MSADEVGGTQSPPESIAGRGGSEQRKTLSLPSSGLGRLLGYLYFIRFSIVLWAFVPLLAVLDWANILTTATRGLFTLETFWALFWTAFFVCLVSLVALLSARIVCAYGLARFNMAPPRCMTIDPTMRWRTLFWGLAPSLAVLFYLGFRAYSDGRRVGPSLICWTIIALLAGLVGALAVWLILTVFYYWSYERAEDRTARGAEKEPHPEARAFLLPVFGKNILTTIESWGSPRITLFLDEYFDLLARLGGPGYQIEHGARRGKLLQGHALAFVLFLYLFLIYYLFLFYTAPIKLTDLPAGVLAISIGLLLLFVMVLSFWEVYELVKKRSSHLLPRIGLLLLVLMPIAVLGWIAISLAIHRDPNIYFPALASVCILMVFVCWGLGALAFIFDRFRIPVVISLAAVVSVLHMLAAIPFGKHSPLQPEHFVQTGKQFDPSALPFPIGVLKRFDTAHCPGSTNPCTAPIVIVTSTGGGIHAAAWTAQMLGRLEAAFPNDKPFHESLLLLSTVSGGSVGAAEWLPGYLDRDRPDRFIQVLDPSTGKPGQTHLSKVSECSSIEAAAWGLVYPDFFHLLFPIRQAGEKFDRGWALQAAMKRNRWTDCDDSRTSKMPEHVEDRPTLGDFVKSGDRPESWIPAFSMNTTAAETGDRFIVANYKNIDSARNINYDGTLLDPASELLPASSFLDIYKHDLPLLGAARLSATFPFVSSMVRVPRNVLTNAYHFGDGGYYDNDGTGTVVEFLGEAYREQLVQLNGTCPKGICPPPKAAPRQIFLVEIRNDTDPHANNPPDSRENQSNPKLGKLWGPLQQLIGPAGALYKAGHESVTRRNRRELCALERALLSLPQPVAIEHYVFAYTQEDWDKAEALNWHLTNADKEEIDRNVAGDPKYRALLGENKRPSTDTNVLLRQLSARFADPGKGIPAPGPCVIEDNQTAAN